MTDASWLLGLAALWRVRCRLTRRGRCVREYDSLRMCGCLFVPLRCASSLSLLKFINYANSSTPTTRPDKPNRPSPNPTRQERPHASLLALHKALLPGGRSGTAHMAMHIAHSSATYGAAHRAPLAHRRSLRAVRTLSLSQSYPIPPGAPERSPSSPLHGRHRSHF